MSEFRIYTRGGDGGETSLLYGVRVLKSDLRIEVIGTIDELSAVLGITRTIESDKHFCDIICRIQKELINFLSEVAAPDGSRCYITQENVNRIELDIDESGDGLPRLTEFVIAGEGKVSAFLHLARTICRRAERRLVELKQIDQKLSPTLLMYLNRLSDLLFVLSRSKKSNNVSAQYPL
ncbi:MAG: cob(I)yrinic acid a,c-diamide adenosyltransferase [Planctomycetaceae bacterium]|jgi:cob(I)alamin adenosyltransferase|nr:cob(I)yrinic acid a,c-diamide adenosyltransferase [Planctomycetaceae bacterium]